MTGERENAHFARLLQAHRSRAGLTQQQLADFATLSVRAVRDLERGRAQRPHRETVRLLADVLRLTGDSRLAFEVAASHHTAPTSHHTAPTSHHTVAGVPDPAPSHRVAPPAPVGAVTGRDNEARLLTDLLTVHRERLVSVVGLSGVGKSSLVAEVGRTVHATHGWPVWWIGAAERDQRYPTRRAAHAAPATRIGAYLGQSGGGDGELHEVLGDTDAVLVVDGDDDRRTVNERLLHLVWQHPRLRVVRTGLTPRRLADERVVPLGGLPLPPPVAANDVAELADCAAIDVLMSHIRRYRPNFRLEPATAASVAGLTRWADGLPRALELVADWCLVHPPERLLRAVRQDPRTVLAAGSVPERAFDIRACVRRTAALLHPWYRFLLVHLGQLAGSFSVAEAAAATNLSRADLTHAVHTLLVHGLVRICAGAPERFEVLNLVRLGIAGGLGGATSDHAAPLQPGRMALTGLATASRPDLAGGRAVRRAEPGAAAS
jgi:DNA-binding XRE family transcriptional regulator/predicted ATPase